MTDNKVIVKLIVPEIDKTYDVLLPVSKKIGNIIELLSKSLSELNNENFKFTKKLCLYNSYNGMRYNFNNLIIETDIRNDSILVLI